MRKQLLIQMPAADADTAPTAGWLLRDETQPAGRFFRGSLSDAAAQAAGARVVALVPGADVLLTHVTLPNLNRSSLAKAVPYALEEQLASDVEELHIAIGNRDAAGRVANAVVARQAIDAWLERLKEAGVHADVLTSEVFGVPLAGDAETGLRWGLLVDGGRACLRTAPQAGVAVETESLPAVMGALLDEAGETLPGELTVTICGEDVFSVSAAGAALRALCEEHGIAWNLHESGEDCPLLLTQGFNEQDAINLLQGDYSRKQQLEKLLRPWLPAFGVLGLWLLLQVGLTGFEYARLSAQDQAMRSRIEAVYREAFPDAHNVVNPRVQMERGLEKLRGGGESTGGGFLPLLQQAGNVLKDTSNLNLRSLRYKDGKLDVDLQVSDLQVLDKLKQRLTDARLKVEIVSATSRDNKVDSRISLAGGGA